MDCWTEWFINVSDILIVINGIIRENIIPEITRKEYLERIVSLKANWNIDFMFTPPYHQSPYHPVRKEYDWILEPSLDYVLQLRK